MNELDPDKLLDILIHEFSIQLHCATSFLISLENGVPRSPVMRVSEPSFLIQTLISWGITHSSLLLLWLIKSGSASSISFRNCTSLEASDASWACFLAPLKSRIDSWN